MTISPKRVLGKLPELLLIKQIPMKTSNGEVPGKEKPGWHWKGTGPEKNRNYSGVEDEAGPGKRKTCNASWVLSIRARLHRWGIEDAFRWVRNTGLAQTKRTEFFVQFVSWVGSTHSQLDWYKRTQHECLCCILICSPVTYWAHLDAS